jgi:hypothetical protein
MQVAVGFFFSLLIIWYFLFRLLFPLLLQLFSIEATTYITFLLSFGICSLMIKPTLKKQMKMVDEPFSIVARNPEIEVPKEKLTLKLIFSRCVFSLILSFVFSLPLTLIIILRFIANPDKDINVFLTFANEYTGFYLFVVGASFFAIFIFVPSLRKWHWTKHQFG